MCGVEVRSTSGDTHYNHEAAGVSLCIIRVSVRHLLQGHCFPPDFVDSGDVGRGFSSLANLGLEGGLWFL